MRTLYKTGLCLTGLVTISLGYAPTSTAQSHEKRCTNFTAYNLGEIDGQNGKIAAQADKVIERCVGYGVTLNKTDYLQGLADGQKLMCTAENGKIDRKRNQSPRRACRHFDNPYMWEFRGQPLVNAPKAGAASFAKADQDLSNDIDLLEKIVFRTKSIQNNTVNEREAYDSLEATLSARLADLKTIKSGQSLIAPAVNSPGPKYRLGLTEAEMISGIFKLSNWKSGDDLSPMRIRKKHCKAGEWEKYGLQHGGKGANIEEEIAKATKKCAKHKVTFDEATYRTGYNKALVDYCGYEKGFFTAIKNIPALETCQSGQHPTYSKGYGHGVIRASYIDRITKTEDIKSFYDNLVRAYNDGVTDGSTVLRTINLRETFGPRKYIGQLIANERVRLNRLSDEINAHKRQHPTLYEGQGFGIEPRPDRELDYPIPN